MHILPFSIMFELCKSLDEGLSMARKKSFLFSEKITLNAANKSDEAELLTFFRLFGWFHLFKIGFFILRRYEKQDC